MVLAASYPLTRISPTTTDIGDLDRRFKIGYHFKISDTSGYVKPFIDSADRRLLRIANNTECTIQLSPIVVFHRGQRMRNVLVTGPSWFNVECCIHQIDESFPRFYSLAPLQRSLDDLKKPKLCDIRRYVTTENLSNTKPIEVTYYKLHFYILSGCHEAYNVWRKGRVAEIIEKMGCHLVVSHKDHPGEGLIRRYAVILGSKREDVMQAYNLFFTSLIEKLR